jgi:hypothetical protein
MKEYDKIPAQAVVEVTTSWGRTCLREIGRDLKEGTVLDRKPSGTTHMQKCWKKETDTSRLKWVE